jgi:phosphocarrier protein
VETCNLSILNALGLHARAAAKFVHTAGRFAAHVRVARGDREVDGKSIMGLLLLAAASGTAVTISAEGTDERAVVDALTELVEAGFGEDGCGV